MLGFAKSYFSQNSSYSWDLFIPTTKWNDHVFSAEVIRNPISPKHCFTEVCWQSQLSHCRDSEESDGSEQEPGEAGDLIKTYFSQTQPNFFQVLVMSLLLICMAGLINQLNVGLGCV